MPGALITDLTTSAMFFRTLHCRWHKMKSKAIRGFIPALFLTVVMLFTGAVPAAAVLFEPANFVLIRGGEFTMGSPEGEVGRAEIIAAWQKMGIAYSETQHMVRLSNFSMSKYGVTVAEFRRFVEASGYQTDAEKAGFSVIFSARTVKKGDGVNWRHGVSGSLRPQSEDNDPVVYVSWNDAVAYSKWLSAQTGKHFRLPTEAEREYACRAGSSTAFNTGQNLAIDQANFVDEKGLWRNGTVPVDSYASNAWGLKNMHGNVFEWCSDWYSGNYYDACKANGTVINPVGPTTGSRNVLRGGSWGSRAEGCRSANRYDGTPDRRDNCVGFRLVYVP